MHRRCGLLGHRSRCAVQVHGQLVEPLLHAVSVSPSVDEWGIVLNVFHRRTAAARQYSNRLLTTARSALLLEPAADSHLGLRRVLRSPEAAALHCRPVLELTGRYRSRLGSRHGGIDEM